MYKLERKIQIGMSACMCGAKVRYNEKGWDMIKHMGRDKEAFVFHPMCPEIMSGMGVPRLAIRIKGESGMSVWNDGGEVVDASGRKWTYAIKDSCRDVMDFCEKQKLDAYIYMEGSPTCGVLRTTLKNNRLGKPPGVLGALLLESEMFLISGTDLQSPIKWWDIKRRLMAFIYLKEWDIKDKATLYEMWHNYKFICQEISNQEARDLGNRLGNLPKVVTQEELDEIKLTIMNMLRNASSPAKIRQMLWKHYTHLRRKENVILPEVKEPTDLRGMHALAKELTKMTTESFQRDVIYGQVPVIYRR
ncbi:MULTISPECIES: DUF523 domain-containing protein [unclassified Fusibacter]|uniref:DUF523 domain-containing protein n=1 Tax=unclassified Fusibacter TaxID=2624464 RepID=UPI001013227B|nr:DUF523 domain-containing protein [Fusibacter sp. A1]MCK8060321.1 DUF523 domain-containing protein [Fusibacter sp. A2]NPE20390.1 DUF523 domain-containing protein [Fusibacter sp. A1]RXV63594.1 DUF523 domain-containing protein [Fusibacter sp. A1]